MGIGLDDLRTPKGGWKREDLELLGLSWPPPKGWLKRLRREAERCNGSLYMEKAAANRERLAKGHARKSAKKAKKKLVAQQPAQTKPIRNTVQKPIKQPDRRLSNQRIAFIISNEFLASYEWRKARYEALKLSDGTCCLCGRGKPHGAILNVDHIKPRRKNPELALDLDNLQVLCDACNHGKGNWDQTDWR